MALQRKLIYLNKIPNGTKNQGFYKLLSNFMVPILISFNVRSFNELFIQVIYCGLYQDTYRYRAQVNNLKQYGQVRLCTNHKGSLSV